MVVQGYSRLLPDAHSPDIHLSHPTDAECLTIWRLSSLAWRDALTLPQYLEESAFLTTVPLAKDGGMTIWILVDKNLPPGQRRILCACESFRKRAFLSTRGGELTETIIHGVASVFTDPAYRGRGYASRLMGELAIALRNWQIEKLKCSGSVLYSDIGKKFYAQSGWHPFPNNSHIEFPPSTNSRDTGARPLLAGDLGTTLSRGRGNDSRDNDPGIRRWEIPHGAEARS
jgi:GNAT superfamily N-acetyltransferase